MKFLATSRFERAYRSLPAETKTRLKDTLKKLDLNFRHPSLHAKKIKGIKGIRSIWEARVDIDHRLTFQIEREYLILRNVGRHDTTIKNP